MSADPSHANSDAEPGHGYDLADAVAESTPRRPETPDHAHPTQRQKEPRKKPRARRKVVTTLTGGSDVGKITRIDAHDPAAMLGALRPDAQGAAHVHARQQGEGPDVAGHEEPADSFLRLRRLVPLESRTRKLTFLTLALLVSLVYFAALALVTAPAHLGIDQNGYLVGGKLLAAQGDMAYSPADPFAFVGGMFVGLDSPATGELVYWPKYPAGLPLLFAICFWAAPDDATAVWLSHYVSPLCASLSVLGMFFLGRFAGGSFLGLLSAIALAGSQLLLSLATNPNSHAPALAFVVWGFVALIAWWRSGRMLYGIAAGLLIGYAFTIRYTEGLLGLPLGIACLGAWAWRRPLSSGLRVSVPVLAWCVPVGGLLLWNKWQMGLWTGYDTTNESTGFSLGNLAANWPTMAEQFNDLGLFFLLPIGVLGVLALLARRLRLGLVLLTWLGGTTLIYTAYYWAPGREWSTAYMRFFLTVLPVLLMGVAYGLWRVLEAPMAADAGMNRAGRWWRRASLPVVAGLVVVVSVGMGAHRAVGILPLLPGQGKVAEGLPGLQADYQHRSKYAALSTFLNDVIQPGDVVLVDSPGLGGITDLNHHLQFATDAVLFDVSMFGEGRARAVMGPDRGVATAGEETAAPLDRRRRTELRALYDGKRQADLDAELQRIIDTALDEGRGVWMLMTDVDTAMFRRQRLSKLDGIVADPETAVLRWQDYPLVRDGSEREPRTTEGLPSFRGMIGMEYAVQRNWRIVPVTREVAEVSAEEPGANDWAALGEDVP